MKRKLLVAAAAVGAIAYVLDEYARTIAEVELRVNDTERAIDAIDYDGLQAWSKEVNQRFDRLEAAIAEANVETVIERMAQRYLQAMEQMRRAVSNAGDAQRAARGFPDPPPVE